MASRASLFAAALHFGWTAADGVAREESWHVRQGHFEFFAARIRKQGGKDDEWEHYWPIARAASRGSCSTAGGLRADYVICGEMWCRPLEYFLPRSRAPVVRSRPATRLTRERYARWEERGTQSVWAEACRREHLDSGARWQYDPRRGGVVSCSSAKRL